MGRVRREILSLIVGCIWAAAVPISVSGAPPMACLPPHRLSILDLGMIPDPVHRGQPIRAWTVTLRSDYNGECLALLEVRDRDQVAGRGVQYLLKPGIGRYAFQAAHAYRFEARDHCFQVLVNLANTWTPIDAARSFCARFRQVPPPPGWSLR